MERGSDSHAARVSRRHHLEPESLEVVIERESHLDAEALAGREARAVRETDILVPEFLENFPRALYVGGFRSRDAREGRRPQRIPDGDRGRVSRDPPEPRDRLIEHVVRCQKARGGWKLTQVGGGALVMRVTPDRERNERTRVREDPQG